MRNRTLYLFGIPLLALFLGYLALSFVPVSASPLADPGPIYLPLISRASTSGTVDPTSAPPEPTSTPTNTPVPPTATTTSSPVPTFESTSISTPIATSTPAAELWLIDYGQNLYALSAPVVDTGVPITANMTTAQDPTSHVYSLRWISPVCAADVACGQDAQQADANRMEARFEITDLIKIGDLLSIFPLVSKTADWHVEGNAFVKDGVTPPTPMPTPTATATPNVWTVDFGDAFGIYSQQEICHKYNQIVEDNNQTVWMGAFYGVNTDAYRNSGTEKPCMPQAGTYINLSVKKLQNTPPADSYDFANKTVTMEVKFNSLAVGKGVYAEMRVQDAQSRNVSSVRKYITAQTMTFSVDVDNPSNFDAAHITALKLEVFATDSNSTVVIDGEVFRHLSATIAPTK